MPAKLIKSEGYVMNLFLNVFLLLSFSNLLALETNIAKLHKHILSKLNTDTVLSLNSISGQWLSTHHQAQIYPGSCNPVRKENISLELYDAWKNLSFVPSKGRKLEPIIQFRSVDVTLPESGIAVITNEAIVIDVHLQSPFGEQDGKIYCALLDETSRGQKALVCFEPAYRDNLNNPCGWYSFFIHE